MNRPFPRSGFMEKMLMQVGSGKEFRNSPYLISRVGSTSMPTTLRRLRFSVVRSARLNLSLIRSRSGIFPRKMRSLLVRSYGRYAAPSSTASTFSSTARSSPSVTAERSASTSFCERIWLMPPPPLTGR